MPRSKCEVHHYLNFGGSCTCPRKQKKLRKDMKPYTVTSVHCLDCKEPLEWKMIGEDIKIKPCRHCVSMAVIESSNGPKNGW